jgi:hypothetical protein
MGISMARRRRLFIETTAYEIYSCYKQHAQKTKTLPNPHVFWEEILVPQLGYQMPWGSLQYHWQRLQIERCPDTNEPYIVIDTRTKAVRVPELDIVERISST